MSNDEDDETGFFFIGFGILGSSFVIRHSSLAIR
jgi:hypothetical protein